MKKFLALMLVALMIVGVFASCGKRGDYVPNASGTDEVTDELLTPDVDGDGNGDEQASDDANTDGGNTDDGNTDDGNTDNGNTDDGNTDNGNTDNGGNNNTDNGGNNTNNGGNNNTDNGGNNNTDNGGNNNTDNGGNNNTNNGGNNNTNNGGNNNTDNGGNNQTTTCAHTGGADATCKTESICSICNQPYGGLDANAHEGTENWVSDANGHKTVYSCCNAAGRTCPTVTAHTYVSGVCECGYLKPDTRHTHNYDANNQCTLCGLKVVGDVVYFGSYPQSAASGSFTAGTWVEDTVDGIFYTDITSGNDKYRGVKTSANGAVSWFKYEPIKWTIVSRDTANNKVLILCDMVIDAQVYEVRADGDGAAHDNSYESSYIRQWLNSTFMATAFADLQQEVISLTTVDNTSSKVADYVNSSPFLSIASNTDDYIFLLSKGEAKTGSPDKGTGADYKYSYDCLNDVDFSTQAARQKKATAYAVASGVYVDDSNGAWWWLRTPSYEADKPDKDYAAQTIKVDGSVHSGVVDTTTGGVVPAMWIYI